MLKFRGYSQTNSHTLYEGNIYFGAKLSSVWEKSISKSGMGAVKFGSGTFPSHSRHAYKYILCMNPNESRFLSCISPVNLFYKTIEHLEQNIKIEMILVKLPITHCKSKRAHNSESFKRYDEQV